MNKRFLLFVLSMTFVLFFVNQYFVGEKQEAQQQVAQQKRQQLEKAATARAKEIEMRSISPESLPLHRLYKDIQGNQPIAWAFPVDMSSYLTVSWESDLPETVFTQDQKGMYHEVHLSVKSDKKGDLALYSSHEKSGVVSTYLPQLGLQDVQLLSLDDQVKVVLGEYEEGQIFFPAKAPQNNSIVLYKLDGSYVPVGLYKVANHKFLPFSQLSDYKEITTYKTPTIPPSSQGDEEFYVLENESMQLVFSIGPAV